MNLLGTLETLNASSELSLIEMICPQDLGPHPDKDPVPPIPDFLIYQIINLISSARGNNIVSKIN